MLKLKIKDHKVVCPACEQSMYKSAFKAHSFAKAKNEAFLDKLGHATGMKHLELFKEHSEPEPVEPKVHLQISYERE